MQAYLYQSEERNNVYVKIIEIYIHFSDNMWSIRNLQVLGSTTLYTSSVEINLNTEMQACPET